MKKLSVRLKVLINKEKLLLGKRNANNDTYKPFYQSLVPAETEYRF